MRRSSQPDELIAVEEKYDAVMENYVELEETVQYLGIRTLAFVERHYEEMTAPLNLVSRRVSNLLSSTRLYRDALPQHASRKDAKHDNPNHPMPYRQMEAVCNYAQHVGPPISDIIISRHKEVNEKNEKRFTCSIIPRMDAQAISRHRDLAPDLRASLASLGKEANPMPIIRSYVEHVGAIHAGFARRSSSLKRITRG